MRLLFNLLPYIFSSLDLLLLFPGLKKENFILIIKLLRLLGHRSKTNGDAFVDSIVLKHFDMFSVCAIRH